MFTLHDKMARRFTTSTVGWHYIFANRVYIWHKHGGNDVQMWKAMQALDEHLPKTIRNARPTTTHVGV